MGLASSNISAERQGLEPWRRLTVDRLAICCITTLPPLQCFLRTCAFCGCKYKSIFDFDKAKSDYFEVSLVRFKNYPQGG